MPNDQLAACIGNRKLEECLHLCGKSRIRSTRQMPPTLFLFSSLEAPSYSVLGGLSLRLCNARHPRVTLPAAPVCDRVAYVTVGRRSDNHLLAITRNVPSQVVSLKHTESPTDAVAVFWWSRDPPKLRLTSITGTLQCCPTSPGHGFVSAKARAVHHTGTRYRAPCFY